MHLTPPQPIQMRISPRKLNITNKFHLQISSITSLQISTVKFSHNTESRLVHEKISLIFRIDYWIHQYFIRFQFFHLVNIIHFWDSSVILLRYLSHAIEGVCLHRPVLLKDFTILIYWKYPLRYGESGWEKRRGWKESIQCNHHSSIQAVGNPTSQFRTNTNDGAGWMEEAIGSRKISSDRTSGEPTYDISKWGIFGYLCTQRIALISTPWRHRFRIYPLYQSNRIPYRLDVVRSKSFKKDSDLTEGFVKEAESLWEQASVILRNVFPRIHKLFTTMDSVGEVKGMVGAWMGMAVNMEPCIILSRQYLIEIFKASEMGSVVCVHWEIMKVGIWFYGSNRRQWCYGQGICSSSQIIWSHIRIRKW